MKDRFFLILLALVAITSHTAETSLGAIRSHVFSKAAEASSHYCMPQAKFDALEKKRKELLLHYAKSVACKLRAARLLTAMYAKIGNALQPEYVHEVGPGIQDRKCLTSHRISYPAFNYHNFVVARRKKLNAITTIEGLRAVSVESVVEGPSKQDEELRGCIQQYDFAQKTIGEVAQDRLWIQNWLACRIAGIHYEIKKLDGAVRRQTSRDICNGVVPVRRDYYRIQKAREKHKECLQRLEVLFSTARLHAQEAERELREESQSVADAKRAVQQPAKPWLFGLW